MLAGGTSDYTCKVGPAGLNCVLAEHCLQSETLAPHGTGGYLPPFHHYRD
jgi:hypothetical protein